MRRNINENNLVDILKNDSGNSNSQDSFNKNLQKIYEEHKKNETKIPHRPMSSYTANRNFNQTNKEIDYLKGVSNKPQSAKATKSKNTSRHSNSKEYQNNYNNNNQNDEIGIDDLLEDLNTFLLSHKITKSDFIDNPEVFLTFDDFIEVLRQIHYNLPKKYLRILFNYDNPEGAKDNYIFMTNFIKNLTFHKIQGIEDDSDFSKNNYSSMIFSKSNSKHSNLNNINNKSLGEATARQFNKSMYEMKYINEQYSQFNKDIMDILKKEKKTYYDNNYIIESYNKKGNRSKNLSASRVSIDSKRKMNNSCRLYNEDNKSKNIEKKLINNYLDNSKNENQNESKKKYDINKILKNMDLEAEKETNYIRNQFDKRDKQFLKDCIYKCEECNRICHLLGINRKYSLILDEEMKCKIKYENEDMYISLKELVIEWRRLYKHYHQKEILEKYKIKEDVNKNKNIESIIRERKKEKLEKHKIIKEVLIEAVKLKTKLKSQLNDLKSNIKIDEHIVLEHLSRAGMDIPGYNINKYNKKIDKK